MLPQVMKRSVNSCLSYVFMTDVFRKLNLALCGVCGPFRFRKIMEVYFLVIRVVSHLVEVVFIYNLPKWKVERFP